MKSALSELLTQIDSLIRLGESAKAKTLLRNLPVRRIPTDSRKDLANCARRLNLPSLALRLLHPLVRPNGRRVQRGATPAEKAEYAGSLIRLGAIDEALELLKQLPVADSPEVLLLESFALFAEWNYRSAIVLLQQYVKSPHLTEYQRLVGNTNLAAALTYENDDSALPLVSQLIAQADQGKWNVLSVNLRMMQAESAIAAGQYQFARDALSVAHESVSEDTLESLFIRKWKWVTELYANPNSSLAVEGVKEVREEAIRRNHWETVRNCDYHLAVATKDLILFEKVYFGTPFESLKKRLRAQFPSVTELRDTYDWKCFPGNSPTQLNLFSPERIRERVAGLSPGRVPYKLLQALCRDFYRPIRVASLHALLYPNEFFNPSSSPARVHQAIKRVRIWFAKNRLPLQITIAQGAYRLIATSPCTISIPQKNKFNTTTEYRIYCLYQVMSHKEFTARDAAKALKLNLWKTIRLLSAAVEKQTVTRTGKANQTKYRFVVVSASQLRAA